MNLNQWLTQIPDALTNDPVWKFEAYPKSLLLFDLVWNDCRRLRNELQGKAPVNQLVRSADSISANIDEGFGRGIERKEYTQFLRIALGSARETRSRYFKLRHSLPQEVVPHRINLCYEIIALLVATIKRQTNR